MKFNSRSILIFLGALLFSLLFVTEALFSQVYPSRTRSPFINWKSLSSDSFVILYPEEARGVALQTALILEDQLPLLQERYRSELTRFPLILNANNSLSNGYVATFPYRSEIEIRPLKGKVLNPGSGTWLEAVVPHELVHAIHYQIKPEGSLTNTIGLFSPDLRRSIHGMVPVGLHEGIAVDHETHSVFPTKDLTYGRGSYPYFINRFEIALTEQPWSLGQIFQISGSTLPYDRHYLGGYAFMSWLRESYGEDLVARTIEEHYKKPFLGYGWALKKETGKWPSTLYEEFMVVNRRSVNERLRSNSSDEKTLWKEQLRLLTPLESFTGSQFNRPLWVSDDQIVAHGRFYNAPTGFYQIHLPDNMLKSSSEKSIRLGETSHLIEPKLIHEVVSMSDYQFSFSDDSTSLLFSKLVPSTHFEEEWAGVVTSLPLKSSQNRNRLLRAPVLKGGFFASLLPKNEASSSFFGVTQNDSNTLALYDSLDVPFIVELLLESNQGLSNHPSQLYSQVIGLKDAHSEIVPVQLQLKPGSSDSVAVIARVRGLQGLWITTKGEIYSHIQQNPPLVSFRNASVLDVSWHPINSRLLLTSDRNQVIQIYELDLTHQTLSQISFSDFNVFEPSYSPSGSSIVFIQQTAPEQLLGVVQLDSIQKRDIDEAEWSFSQNQSQVSAFRPLLGDKMSASIQKWGDIFKERDILTVPDGWSEEDYRVGFTWLKPRLWSPISNEITDSERDYGLFFASVDPLREQSFSSEITLFKEKLWWESTYVYSGFWPGFQITSQKIPSFQTFRFSTGPADDPETTTFTKRLLLRERGVEFSVPFQWNLSPGLHRTSILSFQPSLESTQALFFNESGSSSLSDKVRLTRMGFFISYRHQLRQPARSIFPDRGGLLYFQTEKNIKSKTFELEVENNTYRTNFSEKAGVRFGGAVYFPVISKHNQSGRFLVELIRQTDNPVFSIESLTRNLVDQNPLPGSNGGLFSEFRFAFPLKTVDDGGLTVPLYLNSIYLQTIHQFYLPYQNRLIDGFSTSHSVLGSGVALRSRFRVSNVSLDFGIGLFWDNRSKKGEILIGAF